MYLETTGHRCGLRAAPARWDRRVLGVGGLPPDPQPPTVSASSHMLRDGKRRSMQICCRVLYGVHLHAQLSLSPTQVRRG